MIFQVCIGDVSISLDDQAEDGTPRLMPELAADYLSRCADQALLTYISMLKVEDMRAAGQG